MWAEYRGCGLSMGVRAEYGGVAVLPLTLMLRRSVSFIRSLANM